MIPSHQQQSQSSPTLALTSLDSKIPLKNLHLVQQLRIHKNQQILVVYNNYIHVHSLSRMMAVLPSLLAVIQVKDLVTKMDIQMKYYQDQLTFNIQANDKSAFGETVFGADLQVQNNQFARLNNFIDRVRFLGSQLTRINTIDIHPYGHLLITLQDNRCILIKRNPLSTSPYISDTHESLYLIDEPVNINRIIDSRILNCTFMPGVELSMLCMHAQKQGYTLSKIVISTPQANTTTTNKGKQKKDNGWTVFSIPDNKKVTLQNKGLMGTKFIQNSSADIKITNVCTGWFLLMYYDRLQVVQIGKFNNKNSTFQVFSHKQAEISQQLEGEHAIDWWKYIVYSEDAKLVKIYLPTSASVFQLCINLVITSQQSSLSSTSFPSSISSPPVRQSSTTSNPQSSSWNYTIRRISALETSKAKVYYVDYEGHIYQQHLGIDSQPNYMANFMTETDNGLIVKISSNNTNYKQGFMNVYYAGKTYTIAKIIQNIRSKQRADIPWLNFMDIALLKNNATIKRQLLKEVVQLRAKWKQQPNLQWQIPVLLINMYSSLDSSPQKQKQLIINTIKSHLKIAQFNPTHCPVSNRKIISEDVLYCQKCSMYCIAKEAHSNSNGSCCYVCWNLYTDISS